MLSIVFTIVAREHITHLPVSNCASRLECVHRTNSVDAVQSRASVRILKKNLTCPLAALCSMRTAVILCGYLCCSLSFVSIVACVELSTRQITKPGQHIPAPACPQLDAFTQQQHSQHRIADVLQALARGTIKHDSALNLLKDVASLRSSLDSGAAATRWDSIQAAHAQAQQQQLVKEPGSHAAAKGTSEKAAAEDNTQGQARAQPNRGILIVAGGTHQMQNAFILLKLLSHPAISCTLPVEIVYYGAHEFDASVAAAIRQHAQDSHMTVSFIDGSLIASTGAVGLEPHRAPGRITSFKAKVHALTWVTSFDQVLMLDSDNTPLTDPTPLFDLEAFTTHGSIFWPDFWTNQWMQPALYSLLGLDTPWEVNPAFRACEAGQVLLDRLRHHDVLEYLWLLNTHSNSGIPGAEQGVVGQCLWGDKDTYPIAFQLAGKAGDFYSVQHMPLQALSRPGGSGSTRLVHAGMVHRAPWGSGPLMWLHRTAAGKFYPHCRAHGGTSCRVWAFTAPVGQQQLLAVVRDPSAMALEVSQVDLGWWKQHCSAEKAAAASVDEGTNSCQGSSTSRSDGAAGQAGSAAARATACTEAVPGQCTVDHGECGEGQTVKYSNATALDCDFDKSVDVIPIPVIRTKHLPVQVKKLLQAAQEAFQSS